jgi:MerR family transcriptional regulator, light-induced transcriptional regulator
MHSSYSIKDLENLSGIKAHTLRIWEQRYQIISPKRTDTNIRYYDHADLRLVLNISLLKDHGFKISEIAKMSLEDMGKEVLSLTSGTLQYPDQIQALTIAMLDLDEERFEKIMNTSILRFGFEDTMVHIIYPFMNKVGMLWMTGSVSPAQEHFITYLIRQKIIVATDGQVRSLKPQSQKFLLYLPDGELHELSLLFANYLIRSRGHRTIYLGQSLPFEDLRLAFEVHKPDNIFTIVTSVPGQDEIHNYVGRLSRTFPQTTIMMTGFQIVNHDQKMPDNVKVFKRLDQFIHFISEGILAPG